jgi:NAD(P)-dependent dehydrogenase (short-subunit alcohol dehydrogenase family)
LRGRLLSDTVAIITGGGRGIGAAVAGALAQAGAAVTIAARTTSEIKRTAEQIRKAGGEVEAIQTDISDEAQVRRLVQRTINAFGQIDFLINCAAVAGPTSLPVWEADPEAWRQAIEVNLFGVFLTCHAVIPLMLERGAGRILNVSSGLGEMVARHTSSYATSKAGVNHFTRVLAAELQGTGILANAVYPGVVKTELYGETPGDDAVENHPPILRNAHGVSDVTPLFLWLCSTDTAGMSGQIVRIYDPLVQRRIARFERRRASFAH